MESKDLRIGNWVNSPISGAGEINIVGIAAILKGKHLYEPIPLTEEWLIKFGFEKLDGLTDIFIGGINIYFLRTFYVVFQDKQIIIKHVHQLQNLYHALTGGLELTIINK